MRSRSLPRPLLLRRGGVTPLAILNLSLLVGVVALAVDGGTLMEARRHVQAAADAAALAGATDLYSNFPAHQGIDTNGNARASALATASTNGFVNDGVQSTVTVSISPQNYQGGAKPGQAMPAGYIEVIIQYNAGRLFSGVFGSGTTPIRGRAVARGRCTALNNNNGLILLNMKASAALSVLGFGGLTVNGGIQVNSSSALAVELLALGGITTTALALNPAVGSLLTDLFSLVHALGGVTPSLGYLPPVADPLRYLPPLDPVQLSLSQRQYTAGATDLYPGVYNGGMIISTGTVTLHDNSDGTPGIYYVQGSNGFQVLGSASVTTAANETGGVMIYNNWTTATEAIELASSGNINLMAPTSGPYQGLSIFQKRGKLANPGPTVTIKGSGSVNLAGTIYAAHAKVSLASLSTNVSAGQIIADTLSVNALANVNITGSSQSASSTANLRLLGLVE